MLAVSLCPVPDTRDLLVRHGALKAAEAAQLEAVFGADRADLLRLLDAQFLADAVILVATLERQRHRLGHAGVGLLRREAEIEVEVHRAGHFDHTPLD